MEKKIELLAPVGGKEQLIAAVNNGADAVYMGGKGFNAREYADNFKTDEDMEWAIDYAHLRGVKIYITLNTSIKNEEFDTVMCYAKKLYEMGADAFIVQDLGLLDALYQELPDMPIHMSTQATIYSAEGIKALKKYKNIERVVLARELSLGDIESICAKTDKEIEVFTHGALCVSYSGQCLMSSYIGARSGNRGKCAGPCRLKYELVDSQNDKIIKKENYLLSLKDLCTIDILPELLKTGVTSLKIEGRMKTPEYVALVTKMYRKYLDKACMNEEYTVSFEDKQALLQVYNRGNFSTGYLKEKNFKELWCNGRPKHWGTYLGKVTKVYKNKPNIDVLLEQDLQIGDGIEVLNESLTGNIVSFMRKNASRVSFAKKGSVVTFGDIRGNILEGQEVYKITDKALKENVLNNVNKKIKIEMSAIFKIGKQIEVKLRDIDTNIVVAKKGEIYEVGVNKKLSREDILNQLSKLGNYQFEIQKTHMDVDEIGMISLSKINNIRNEVAQKLQEEIIQSYKRKIEEKEEIQEVEKETKKRNNSSISKISVYLYKLETIDKIIGLNGIDRIYVPLEQIRDGVDYICDLKNRLNGIDIFVYLPPVTNVKYKKIIEDSKEIFNIVDGLLVTNIEHVELFNEYLDKLWLDNNFNVFNNNTANMLKKMKVLGISLSPELNEEEVLAINSDIKKEVTIYGRVRLMYSEYCLIGKKEGCKNCKNGSYYLKDRMGARFPVLTLPEVCTNSILNSKQIYVPEIVERLKRKVEYFRIAVFDEDREEIEKIVNNVYNILGGNGSEKIDKYKYTTGHWYRGV